MSHVTSLTSSIPRREHDNRAQALFLRPNVVIRPGCSMFWIVVL